MESALFAQQRGEVLIYTGTFQWIDAGMVNAESTTCEKLLKEAKIPVQVEPDQNKAADWIKATTDNGKLDVFIMYGDIPPSIYPGGNAKPDGSLAEKWIETKDGDMYLNHADYMFWGVGGRNKEGGLQNMMDIPGIVMWDDDTPMKVTADGKKYTPSLKDYNTDRPFHLDQLADNWKIEKVFASNSGDDKGTRADPVIVRDGNLGRLCIAYQTASEKNPKGEVASEIIINYIYKEAAKYVDPQDKLSSTWGAIKRSD